MFYKSLVDEFVEPVALIVKWLSLLVNILHLWTHHIFVDLRNKGNHEIQENDQREQNAQKPNSVYVKDYDRAVFLRS